MEHDPEKVVSNFSNYELSNVEKKLLAKVLKFCLAPKQLNYADYLVHFELLYRNIRNLEILSYEDLGFVKKKLRKQHYLHIGNTKVLNKIFRKENLKLWQV